MPASSTTLVASLSEEHIELTADTENLAMQRTDIDLPVGELRQVVFRGRRSGGESTAVLFVATDGAVVVGKGSAIELDWPADGLMHEVEVPEASLKLAGERLTGVALVVFSNEAGPLAADIDFFRIGVTDGITIPGANFQCGVQAPRHSSRWPLWLGLVGLGVIALRRRR